MPKHINVGFMLNAPMPIDGRMQVATFGDLDLIPVKYDRMTSYVLNEDEEYRYFANIPQWVKVSFLMNDVHWGDILGNITSQVDLMAEFNKYALVNHTHPRLPPIPHQHLEVDITDLDKYTKSEVDTKLSIIGSTSLLVGGEPSWSPANPTHISLTAGTIMVMVWNESFPLATPVKMMYDFPGSTTVIDVGGSAYTNLSLRYDSTLLAVVVDKTIDTEEPADLRSSVPVAFVDHPDGSIIDVYSTSTLGIDTGNQMYDLFSVFGTLSFKGHHVTPNGANLELDLAAGSVLSRGCRFHNDQANPHISETAAITKVQFKYRTSAGVETPLTTALEPDVYEDATGTTGVPTDHVTIQRVYLSPNGSTVLQYGQEVYDDIEDAVANLTDPFNTHKGLEDKYALLGYVFILQGASSLLDPKAFKYIPAGIFGIAYSGGGGGGGATPNKIDIPITAQVAYVTVPKVVSKQAMVFVNGVLQKGSSYSVLGQVITFDSWLQNGDLVSVQNYDDTVATTASPAPPVSYYVTRAELSQLIVDQMISEGDLYFITDQNDLRIRVAYVTVGTGECWVETMTAQGMLTHHQIV